MKASDVLAELATRGITVTRDGDRLRLRGRTQDVTDAQWAALRTHKATLLAALRDGDRAADGAHPSHNSRYSQPGANCVISETTDEEWPEPVAFEALTGPAFPTDALPDVLAAVVQDVVETHQVAVDLAGTLGLGAVAAAAAGSADVQIGGTHKEPLNLYLLGVADSGERKGPPFRDLLAPLDAAERAARTTREPAIEEARRQRAIEEARLKHLTERAAKEEDEEKRAVHGQAAKALAGRLTTVPAMPRFLVGNITPEKLEGEMADQGGVLALASEEGGDFVAIAAGRYSKDGGAHIDTFLKAYDGGRITTDRQTRARVDIERPALTVILTVQPGVLRRLRDVPDFAERGLLARPLYAIAEPKAGTRRYRDRTRAVDPRQQYAAAIARLVGQRRAVEARPSLLIRGDALAVWAAGADRIEREQADGGRFSGGLVKEWASKHAGRVARLAGLLHAVRVTKTEPWAVPIAPETVTDAWRLGDYFAEHALATFALMGGESADMAQARRFLAWITRHTKTEFSLRDLHQHHRNVERPTDLVAGLRVLEARGFIRPTGDEARPGRGRPPSPAWVVNPRITSHKSPKSTGREFRDLCDDSEPTESGTYDGPPPVEDPSV